MGAQRILIVDSHVDNAEALALLLAGDECLVEIALSGQHAIARAIGWRPDLIVLDLGLPDVSGEDVAEALRAGGSTAYIVAYSGFHKRQADAMAAGCNAFVLKPELEPLLAIAEAVSAPEEGDRVSDPFNDTLYALRVRVLNRRLKSALLAVRSHEQVTATHKLIAEQNRRPRWRRLRLVRSPYEIAEHALDHRKRGDVRALAIVRRKPSQHSTTRRSKKRRRRVPLADTRRRRAGANEPAL